MFIRILMLLAFSASVYAGQCPETIYGRYENPDYPKQTYQQTAHVTIEPLSETMHSLIFEVPCGSKLTPKLVELTPSSCVTGSFKVIEEGGSQCFLGATGDYTLYGRELILSPSKIIRTPGFNGRYKFKKVN